MHCRRPDAAALPASPQAGVTAPAGNGTPTPPLPPAMTELPQSIAECRIDGRLKVTGAARYVGDMTPAGCLHGALVQSTIARGRLLGIDIAAAAALPGVRRILTPANALRLHPAPVMLGGKASHAASAGESRPPLQDDRIHYSGQHLAMVVAETPEIAAGAAARLVIHVAPEPPHTDLADPARPALPPENAWGDPAEAERGDFTAGWAAGSVRVAARYRTALQHHNPMELHATIAEWEGDFLTVHEPTTWVGGMRRTLAAWFGLPEANIRVRQLFVGGSFGCKGPAWPHVALTAMAARMTGRPVKLVLSRRENFTSNGHRASIEHAIRLAADRDGRLTALAHDALTHSSMLDRRVVAPVTKTSRRLYACPNVRTRYRMRQLDLPGPFTMRGPGESPGMFALECAMDELAVALGMDPVALRLANDAAHDPERQLPWSSRHFRECCEQGAARFGWHERPPAPRSWRDGRDLIGWGMAAMAYDARALTTSARAILDADDMLTVQSATCEQGTGSLTVFRRIAAEAFGWPVERTRFELGDTAFPTAPISAGSMTTASVGTAVQAVSRELRDRVIELARHDPESPLHGLRRGEITIAAARMQGPGNRTESIAGLLRRNGRNHLMAETTVEPAGDTKRSSRYSFGAHFAEVRVDASLGVVRVSRYVGAFAAGHILNPKLAESQLIGGIVWGIGMALHEETQLDDRLGRMVNADLAEYHVPANADIGAAIDAFFIPEQDTEVNPLGVKGIGEIGTIGAAPAIANAIWHATGRRIRKLPIRLDALI